MEIILGHNFVMITYFQHNKKQLQFSLNVLP